MNFASALPMIGALGSMFGSSSSSSTTGLDPRFLQWVAKRMKKSIKENQAYYQSQPFTGPFGAQERGALGQQMALTGERFANMRSGLEALRGPQDAGNNNDFLGNMGRMQGAMEANASGQMFQQGMDRRFAAFQNHPSMLQGAMGAGVGAVNASRSMMGQDEGGFSTAIGSLAHAMAFQNAMKMPGTPGINPGGGIGAGIGGAISNNQPVGSSYRTPEFGDHDFR